MSNRSKYRKNINLWKKVYGTKRRKPNLVTYTNAALNTTSTYDLNKIFRFRDVFLLKNPIEIPDDRFGEYDEGLIYFSNVTNAAAVFNFVFSGVPDAVVLTVDDAVNNSNFVIPFGVGFDASSLIVQTSAPFTGNIRYRAVYSSTGYPVFVRSPLVPLSGNFRVSAGSILVSNTTNYTASFSPLANAPSLFYETVWEANNNNTANVYLTKDVITTDTVKGGISAPIDDKIYFIAVQ